MRKAITTLVRVRSWQLQDTRRRLGEAVREIEAIDDQRRALHAEIAAEQACARAGPLEAGISYAAYAEAAHARGRRIAGALDQAKEKERALRAELEDAFGELKRVELFAEGCTARETAERKARDGVLLDEMAVGGFVRRTRARDAG